MEKTGKNRKFRENIGNLAEKSEKIGKSWKKSGKIGIIEISVEISYRSPPITEISAEILFPGLRCIYRVRNGMN